MVTVSIVCPVFGPEHYLRAMLAALWTHTPEPFELILVDNGTGYVERVLDDCALVDVETIVNPVNLGFAVACNQGAQVATREALIFLNVDTEPRPDWLAPLVHALSLPGVGIAGSKLVYPDGRIQHAGIESYHAAGNLEFRNIHDDLPSRYVEGVTGACLAITRECFDACGGWDEGYDLGYEDCDLCLTAKSLGYEIWYAAESVVMHHESATGGERWRSVAHNVARMQAKWSSEGVR